MLERSIYVDESGSVSPAPRPSYMPLLSVAHVLVSLPDFDDLIIDFQLSLGSAVDSRYNNASVLWICQPR